MDLLSQHEIDVIAGEYKTGDAVEALTGTVMARMPGESAAARKPRSCGPTSEPRVTGWPTVIALRTTVPSSLWITVRLALHIISVLHQFLRPGLIGEAFSIDDRADWKRLLGDQHLRTKRNGGSSSGLLRAGAGEHILGHDRSDYRDDQRSNEQRELLHIHGEIASPDGPLEQPQKSDKLVKKPLGENCETPDCDGDPVRNFGSALAALRPMPGENAQRQHAAGNRHRTEI